MEALSTKDYRQILADSLRARLERNPHYSQRAFARDLKLAPHRLSEILRGKQGLSRPWALKIAKSLGLSSDEAVYFSDLVDSQHARSISVREQAAMRVSEKFTPPQSGDKLSPVKNMELEKFNFIADWFHFAILELARLPKFTPTPRWISRRLGIQETQANQALERLVTLGFATKKSNVYHIFPEERGITGGVSSEAIRSFHRQILEKALTALQTQGLDDREFNSSVLAISKNRLPELKIKIQKFWKEVFSEFSNSPQECDEVYGLTVQAFRLSETVEDLAKTKKLSSKILKKKLTH